MGSGMDDAFKNINFNFDYNMTKTEKYPNAKLHQITSFIKSGIRIIGYGFLPFNLALACGILIISEVVGIVEELV
tara:strand:+ start:819 stop:1043 length:225 start_codon:yes stop_codon:yes gene_type:complete